MLLYGSQVAFYINMGFDLISARELSRHDMRNAMPALWDRDQCDCQWDANNAFPNNE
jgi:hypothetical protein